MNSLKILVIGSGGREHAIVRRLSQDSVKHTLYCAPGNPGTAQLASNVPLSETQINELIQFAKSEKIDITLVGPEGPLVAGIVDAFEAKGLAIVGPSKQGAQLEGSKAWSKHLMKKYGIPSASFEVFTHYELALTYVRNASFPLVIKADGLAAGKGVVVAQVLVEAEQALKACFIDAVFADAGKQVVIESFLKGEEASILAFTDGNVIVPMVAAQDHKAIFDDDKGPNTGGMGAYSPVPLVTPAIEKKVLDTVLNPLLKAFQTEGIRYKGIVYAGLMIDGDEVNVVEFNARFGDPETQVVLPRLKTDFASILQAIVNGNLAQLDIVWHDQATVCVVVASGGYPGTFEKDKVISGLEEVKKLPSTHVIYAGTRSLNAHILSSGGRVLGLVGEGPTLEEAIAEAYKGVALVSFENAYFRTDIGQKALARLQRRS